MNKYPPSNENYLKPIKDYIECPLQGEINIQVLKRMGLDSLERGLYRLENYICAEIEKEKQRIIRENQPRVNFYKTNITRLKAEIFLSENTKILNLDVNIECPLVNTNFSMEYRPDIKEQGELHRYLLDKEIIKPKTSEVSSDPSETQV